MSLFPAAPSAQTLGVGDPKPEIEKAYAGMSAAWANHDPAAAVMWMADPVTLVDLVGKSTYLTHEQQADAARDDMRQTPGTRYLPRQTTVVQSIRVVNREATVQQTTIKELTTVDAQGTIANVRFVIVSQDSWVRLAIGWRLSVYHVTAFQRYAEGSPSPAIALALQRMRSTNSAMRSFDAAVNFSNCMHANQNQGIDYQSRKLYCGPEH
jgi:hypothetical protein